MKNLLRSAVLALGLCSLIVSAFGAEYLAVPSDPNASQETRNVYDYLRTRRGQTANRVIEGQFLGMINQILYPGQSFYGYFDINQHAIDGKLPAMAGSRYDGLDKETEVYRLDPDICSLINLKLIDSWNQAHPIIHITAVPRNPWNQDKGRNPDNSATQKIGKLLRAATGLTLAEEAVRDSFWADIDVIAGGLQELEDAGIPVLFRPFAEFNQSNKYYYDQQSATDFQALWAEVFHYYVDDTGPGKGLHNLLFCWEVWALNLGTASANIAPWYPIDPNTVDVVAGAFYFLPDTETKYYLDPVTGAFSFDHSDPDDQGVYNFLIAQNRPFGAAQYGLNQNTNVPGDHAFTLAFMTYSADLAFAAYWNQYQAVERQANASVFVADQRVATHDDLPEFRTFPATVTLGNLNQTYDGTPRPASATTVPAGLNVIITYDGGGTAPTNAGSYAVVGTISDPNFFGSASGTLVVAQASATVTLGSLTHTYDGAPKSATATTVPAGLPVTFTYDGSSTPPSAVGSYAVVGTVTHANYTGTATGTMTILAPPTTVTFTSLAAEDGWVLESGENTNVGSAFDANATNASALRVGDNAANKQLKLIVSFDTQTLPPGATIVSATLKLKRGTVNGTTPFGTHGACTADISTGGFNNNPALEAADFEAGATASQVATMSNPVADGDLSTGALNAAGLGAISRTGHTQLRLSFALDDNDDGIVNFVGFYSGNHTNAANRPVLEVVYQ